MDQHIGISDNIWQMFLTNNLPNSLSCPSNFGIFCLQHTSKRIGFLRYPFNRISIKIKSRRIRRNKSFSYKIDKVCPKKCFEYNDNVFDHVHGISIVDREVPDILSTTPRCYGNVSFLKRNSKRPKILVIYIL